MTHVLSLPHSPLPVPVFALTVKEGAARFGLRTPEPHVWPAAPRQIMRGEDHRGVGMSEDQALPLPARIAELRAKADQKGLTLQEAMLAFCDLSKATELLDLDPHNVDYLIIRPSRSLILRVELCAELRDNLLSGALVAYGLPLDASPLEELKEIPSHFWEESTLYTSNNQAADLDGATIGRLRIKKPVADDNLPKALPITSLSSPQKGRTPSDTSNLARKTARKWLEDEGEDLKEYSGKQARCEKHVQEALSNAGASLSISHVRDIVKKESLKIAQEKAAARKAKN